MEVYKYWIDIAKGIGIVLVALAHTQSLDSSISSLIYSFHMPLFFILSGYLLKSYNKSESIKKIALHKAHRLLLPLFCYMLLIVVPMEYSACMNHKTSFFNAGWRFINVYTSQRATAFWFPFALFESILGYYLLRKFFHVRMEGVIYIYISLMLLSLGYFLDVLNIEQKYIPLGLNRILVIIPLLVFGTWYKQNEMQLPVVLVYSLAGLIALLSLFFLPSSQVDMKNGHWGIPYLSFMVACSFTLLIIGFSKIIEKIFVLREILAYLGKASLTIMFLHIVAWFVVREYIGGITGLILTLLLCCVIHFIISRIRILRYLLVGTP